MTEILLSTFIYLAFAVASVLISQKLGLGSVLGYIFAGVLVGPILHFVGKETESIQHIAEFGVVMMLFLVGLELAPQMLWQLRHKLLGLGGLQVLLTLGAITGIAVALGYSWQIGVAIGCILSLSSTAIVLQTFNEKQLLNSSGGQAGLAVLLFQDVAAIPMLALMPLLAVGGISARGSEHGHTTGNLLVNQPVWVTAVVNIAAIVLIVVAVRYLVPTLIRIVIKSRVREMFMGFTLLLIVGIATLMSVVGLSPALGAFIAGVSLANSQYRHELESNLEPFKGLFLGLFFITVGAGMNFHLLQEKFFPIIGITIALLLLKSSVLFILGKIFRLSALGTKLFALALAQAGEFGFVLLSTAKSNHVLPTKLLDRMSLVIALSMVLTPLLFIFYEKFIAPRAIQEENEHRENDSINEENPVILLGHGRFGQHINSLLTACGFHLTVIDSHAEMVEGLAKLGIKTYYGDASNPELLSSAGLAKAKLLIVALGEQHEATEVVEFVRRHYPNLPIIARAHDRIHAYHLLHAGATYVIREISDSAIRTGRIALEKLGLSPEKARELSKFYAARDRYLSDRLAEVYDPNISTFANEDLMRTFKETDAETQAMIQALLRNETVDWEEVHENDQTKMKLGIS
jgi:transporter, monovalent cation:proton antiporter-2 (CPA2) family